MSGPIQIVDEHDRPIATATKQETWERGLIHRCVRLMVRNRAGQVLLQHRSSQKDIFPNCWDSSAAGHVDAGEDYETAMRREIQEELGWPSLDLILLGRYYDSEVWQGHKLNRFNQCYKAESETTPTWLEPGKIDGWRWWEVAAVKGLISQHPDQVTDGLRQIFERYY